MVRTYQGGSILGFVVIGSVLALLLIGGAYFVRQNLVPDVSNDQPYTQQDESDEAVNSEDVDTSEDDQSRQDDTATQSGSNDSESDEQSDDDPLPVAGNSNDDSNPEVLPQTGPSDTLIPAFMIGLLAAIFVSYKRSRDFASSL